MPSIACPTPWSQASAVKPPASVTHSQVCRRPRRSLDELPVEILFKVFEYLSVDELAPTLTLSRLLSVPAHFVQIRKRLSACPAADLSPLVRGCGNLATMQDRLQDSLVSLQAGRFFDDHPILRRAGETPTAPSLLSVFRELGLFVPEGETQAQDDTRPSLLGPLASVPAEIQDLAEHLFAQDLHEYTHVLRIDEHAVRIVLERCLASAQTADDPGRHRHRHQHRPRSDGTACCSDAAVAIDETCATASPNRSTAAAWIVRGDCCFGVSAGCSDDDQASRTRAILRGTGVSIEEARRQLQAELLQSQA